jgi:VWFA-related protein
VSRSLRVALVPLLFALAPAAVPGDGPQETPSFDVSAELVYVRFHVETKGGYARDVRPDQIRVLEDGRVQPIVLLETPSTRERTVAPEVTLLLDVSGSVLDARLLDEDVLREALLAALSEQATVSLCAFGGELRCLAPPTRETGTLVSGFRAALAFGYSTRNQGTRLFASVADVASQAPSRERAQRAIVLFSDGLDNRGGKLGQAVRAAVEADVRVYAVKLGQAFRDAPIMPGPFGAGPGRGAPNRAYYDYKKLELDDLAEQTGGRSFEPATLEPREIAVILREIATEIATECVVGYAPQGAPSGRERRVKVEVVDKSIGRIRDGERRFRR